MCRKSDTLGHLLIQCICILHFVTSLNLAPQLMCVENKLLRVSADPASQLMCEENQLFRTTADSPEHQLTGAPALSVSASVPSRIRPAAVCVVAGGLGSGREQSVFWRATPGRRLHSTGPGVGTDRVRGTPLSFLPYFFKVLMIPPTKNIFGMELIEIL